MPIYLSSQFDLRAGLPIRKYMTVANTSQRDAIPSINRHEGFITYVADIEKNYQLQGGITNSDWVELLSSTISADWSDVTNKPTTESGYGITDGFTSWDKDYDDLINKPTINTYSAGNGLGLSGTTFSLDTPSTLTSSTTNAVTTDSHTHAITGSLGLVGNGSAQYQVPITGATPFAPTWTTALNLVGTNGLNGLSYASASFVKMTGVNTFTLDTNTYLTALPNHNLIDTTHHPVSGLTTGHFLKATGATAYGFAAHGLTYTDVGAQQSDATLTALAGLTITQGSLIYGTGADAFSILAKGTAGQVLKMNAGETAPEWGDATSGSPAGTGTELQYRNGASFGASQFSFVAGTQQYRLEYNGVSYYIGYNCGNLNATGTGNIGIGRNNLYQLNNGDQYNIAIGYSAGYSLAGSGNADNNVFIGLYSGYTSVSGARNVFYGAYSGYYETGTDKLFIDNQDRTDEATSRTSSLIYGEFNATPASQIFRVNGILEHSLAPNKPKIYTQATEPDIPNDTMAFWKDSDDSKYYLILDIGGTQKKVELT
jgi:hypothetical protein